MTPPLASVLVLAAIASAASFALYGLDKAAAVRGARRVPEATLHILALLGGWPGALAGQLTFRHKTRKQPFRAVFWATAAAHTLAVGWLLTHVSAGG